MKRKNKHRIRKFIRKHTVLTIILAVLIALFIITPAVVWYLNNFTVITNTYVVNSNELPTEFDGYNIVMLSDLHCREYGKNNKSLIKLIKKQKPDIILLCGDMINWNTNDFDSTVSLCEKVAEISPTYYVYGNHEQMRFDKQENAEQMKDFESRIEATGVSILQNESVELEKNGQTINLIGLTMELYFYSGVQEDGTLPYIYTVENAHSDIGVAKEGYNLLLTHNPIFFDAYAAWGADLTLCGHMHGGVVTLPFAGSVFSPTNDYFPEYAQGRFEQGSSSMIVGRGLGEHKGRYRLFTPQEIVAVKLNKI